MHPDVDDLHPHPKNSDVITSIIAPHTHAGAHTGVALYRHGVKKSWKKNPGTTKTKQSIHGCCQCIAGAAALSVALFDVCATLRRTARHTRASNPPCFSDGRTEKSRVDNCTRVVKTGRRRHVDKKGQNAGIRCHAPFSYFWPCS